MLAVLSTALLAAPAVAKPDKPVKVNANGDAGWMFARDLANATPYSFSLAQRTLGAGSLFVEPISATPAHKFIAEQPMNNSLVSDLQSISYDFLIAGNGTAADEDDFYLNVYTHYPTPVNGFFDCRFDYVPSSGSTTAWTTASFAATDTPAAVNTRGAAPPCPATLAAMPAGSTVSFFSLNVGQTTASDAGLAGYLDNVVVSQSDGSTTYDLDPHKDACKKGGFAAGGFKNQGECVAAAT
jgi:hypothetical protein